MNDVEEPDRNGFTAEIDIVLTASDPVAAGTALRPLAESAAQDASNFAADLADSLSKYLVAITSVDDLSETNSDGEITHSVDPAAVAALLRILHQSALVDGKDSLSKLDRDDLMRIATVVPSDLPNASLSLHLIAMLADADSLGWLIDRLVAAPPEDWIEAAQVISPLMQSTTWSVDSFFPAALELIAHPSLASPILDLAGDLYRRRGVRPHVASERVEMLNQLLGQVTMRLSRFEDEPRTFGDDVETVSQRLGAAVSLAVSLCDAVGLIGDSSSIGKLNQAVELRHRRVQCEAAGALAVLGDEGGKQRLIQLASEPAARLRAIQYADEIGIGDLIDGSFRSDQAIAEAEVALWLSQPSQMGVPPTAIKTIESRQYSWPGFENPMDVHLVQFEYRFAETAYSNVAISGPVTFALSTDVADLPADDIYSIYAGWHAEHDEIFSVDASALNASQKRIMAAFDGHLEREGYTDRQPSLLGVFLDELAGVFTAQKEDSEMLVITDGVETIEKVIEGRLRPMRPEDIFHLYKGRKMLRTFNS